MACDDHAAAESQLRDAEAQLRERGADGAVAQRYKLSRSRLAKTGVMIGHYERAGAIELGAASAEILTDNGTQ